MKSPKSSVKAELFIGELRKLIRTGVMAAPALESSHLIDLPVVQKRCAPDASPSQRAYTFIEVLHQVISQRLQGKDIEAACILFGLERYAGVPQRDRYRAVAKLYNKHWAWENYRKEPLTRFLSSFYYVLEREAELAPAASDTLTTHPRKARTGLVGQDWVQESYEATYTFPSKPGQPFETIQKRRLRAICDGASFWRDQVQWRERGISATPQVSLFGPGVVSIPDTYVDKLSGIRIFVTNVQFVEPIKYGQIVEFTLYVRLNVKYDEIVCDSGSDWFGLLALRSPMEYAQINLHFPPHKQPRNLWSYEGIINGIMRPGVINEENRLLFNTKDYVSHSWTDLSAGLSYGISLEW